jgi:hypothetical protein
MEDIKTQCITEIAVLDKQIKKSEERIARHKDYEYSNFMISLLRLQKIERLIYVTILKGPNPILDLYREKIEEILSDTHQISSDFVKKGIFSENQHLIWCSDTLRQQKYIKSVCDCYKN